MNDEYFPAHDMNYSIVSRDFRGMSDAAIDIGELSISFDFI